MDIDYNARESQGERYARRVDAYLLRVAARESDSMDLIRRYGDSQISLVTPSLLASSRSVKKGKVKSA